MTKFQDMEMKRASEEVAANELLLKLKGDLEGIDERFLREQSKSSVDLENAKKLIAGIDVSDLGQPLANFREQRRALLIAINLQAQEIKKIVSKKRVQLRLLRPWGGFRAGEEVIFDPRKGIPLIEKGIGIEVLRTLKENPVIRKNSSNERIRLKLLKPWGGYDAGSIMDFGESKGWTLIDNGTAIEVSKKKKKLTVKAGKKKPKVENKIAEPVAETA